MFPAWKAVTVGTVQFQCVRGSFIASTIRKTLAFVLLTAQVHVVDRIVDRVALIESVSAYYMRDKLTQFQNVPKYSTAEDNLLSVFDPS